MQQHEKLDYVEFPSLNLERTKTFFSQAFNWSFEDYGPDYCAFDGQGLLGGFFTAEKVGSQKTGSALLIFYSKDLEATQAKVLSAGGRLIKEIFDFPGGRRFHFQEPGGNELAVWSER